MYPVLLIGLTWVILQLYSRNCWPLVWLWNRLCWLMPNRNSKPNLVDTFATFFFLSYTKLCFLSASMFGHIRVHANSTQVYLVTNIDPSIHFFSKEHIPHAVIGALVLLIFGILPALFLVAYPIRKLRSLLLIDCLGGRSSAALNIFMEKFYSCYRDDLDGAREGHEKLCISTPYHYIINFTLKHMDSSDHIVWCMLLPGFIC